MGLLVATLAFLWFGAGFGFCGGTWLYRPMEVPRIYALLGLAADGCPGHGPLHLVVESASAVGFSWDAVGSVWCRPGLPGLSLLAGPYQHFKAAIWDAWRSKVSFYMCQRQGFRGGGAAAGLCWLPSAPTCPTCKRKG